MPVCSEASTEPPTRPVRGSLQWRAALASAAFLTLLEAITFRFHYSATLISEQVWLFGAAVVWLTVLQAPLVLLLALFLPRVQRRGPSRKVRIVGATSLLVTSAAAHMANALLLVRLYALLHTALGGVAIVSCFSGVVLLLQGRQHAGERANWSRTQVFAVAGFVATGALLLSCVLWRPVLRTHALQHTTFLSQLVRAAGVLGLRDNVSPPAGSADSPQVQAPMLQPLRDPRGLTRRANVLLLTVDAMRADKFPGGSRAVRLPSMEAIAQRGTYFSRAYSPSCWTVHAMTSVLTSRLPSQLAFTPVTISSDFEVFETEPASIGSIRQKAFTPAPVRDKAPTLASILRRRGYFTATVVPYALYLREAGVTKHFEVVDDTEYRKLSIDGMGVADVHLVEPGLRALQQRNNDQPFFLWLHFMAPHAPYLAHDDQARGGSDEARYDSELRYVDAQIEKLLAGLTAQGAMDNTIVILHGDHGEEFRDHGGQYHATTLYQEQVRVPLAIAVPERVRSSLTARVDSPVSLLDITPTVVDLLGIETRAELMGRSLAGPMLGRPQDARTIFLQCNRFSDELRGAVDWPWKLIEDRTAGTLELYELQADPFERNNIIEQHPGQAGRLLRLLDAVPNDTVRTPLR